MSDKKDEGILKRTFHFLKDAIEYLLEAISYDCVREGIYDDLGIDRPADETKDYLKQLHEKVSKNPDRFSGIERYLSQTDPDKQALEQAIQDIKVIYEALPEVVKAIDKSSDEETIHRILKLLSANYIRIKFPFIYWWAQPLGFLEETVSIYSTGDSYKQRFENLTQLVPYESSSEALQTEQQAIYQSNIKLAPLGVALGLFDKLTMSLVNALEKLFTSDDLPMKDDLTKDAKLKRLYKRIKENVSGGSIYGWDTALSEQDGDDSKLSNADRLAKRTLSFSLTGTTDIDGDKDVEATFSVATCFIPAEHEGGPGLFIVVGGSGKLSVPLFADWKLNVELSSAGVTDFLIGKTIDVGGPSDGTLKLVLERPPSTGNKRNMIPDGKSTRLEFDRLALEAEVSTRDAYIKGIAENSTLVISDTDCPSWLQAILPKGGIKIDFDLALGFSNKNGLFLEGGTNLTVNKAIAKSFGPVKLNNLLVSLSLGDIDQSSGIQFKAATMITAKLWDLTITIDQAGFVINFVDGKIGFKSPNGVGINIKTSTLNGGGYLFYDEANDQYAGALQLSTGSLQLSAVGLLTTRLPDGSHGFSLFISIAATFCKDSIGPGFTLLGVGGVVGINRSVNTEFLRNGLKNHTMDSVLFPPDPLSNIAQIVSNLKNTFPVTPGRHVIGLMAKGAWGSGTMITMELGLLVEAPSPYRLILLGQLFVNMPSEKTNPVQLKMDCLGVIDFGQGKASLDAALYDSRLHKFPVTGDMAMRTQWKDDPLFIISIGGFNPGFKVSGVPQLARVSIKISKSDDSQDKDKKENPRLIMQAYLAFTSNTAQVGAQLDFYVAAGNFNVTGSLGFDGFFQFTPFKFLVSIRGKVALKWKSHNLLGVALQMSLEGPTVWHVYGKATFEILWFSKSVSFDKHFGESTPPSLPAADPMQELLVAFANASNWQGKINGQDENLVTVIEFDASVTDKIFIHPLSNISVRQQVVPLGVEINRFGNTLPSGDRLFTINDLRVAGEPVNNPQVVEEFFAPGQFIQMDESAALNRPSFEKMQAGVKIPADTIAFGGELDNHFTATVDLAYEEIIIGGDGELQSRATKELNLSDNAINTYAAHSSVGKTILQARGSTRYRASTQTVVNNNMKYVVVGTDDLNVVPGDLDNKAASFTVVDQILKQFLVNKPDQKGKLQIIKRPVIEETV